MKMENNLDKIGSDRTWKHIEEKERKKNVSDEIGSAKNLEQLKRQEKLKKPLLDEIGSSEIWEKIIKKGEQGVVAGEVNSKEIWRHVVKKEEKRKEKLKDVSFYNETISKDEIRRLCIAQKFLSDCVESFEEDLVLLKNTLTESSLEYKKQAEVKLHSKLLEMENGLDGMNLWVSKFSTDHSSGGGPVSEGISINPEKDSIYYVTASGASLRIRKVGLEDGKFNLRGVVQPFAEKICFYDYSQRDTFRKFAISLTPEIGSTVHDFFGSAFRDMIKEEEINHDFVSAIKIYKKDDKVVDIVAPEGHTEHNGDFVNKIFFQKDNFK